MFQIFGDGTELETPIRLKRTPTGRIGEKCPPLSLALIVQPSFSAVPSTNWFKEEILFINVPELNFEWVISRKKRFQVNF